MKHKQLLHLIPLAVASIFCSFGSPASPVNHPDLTQDVSAIVSATLTAVSQTGKADVPTTVFKATPEATTGPRDFIPAMGTVSGEELRFPAARLPGLRITFFNMDGTVAAFTDTAPGQNSYFMDVPAGTYTLVAYSLGGDGFIAGTAGGYTQAVPCGLDVNCEDHRLIPIVVVAGQTVTGINPNDYYAPEHSFPPMP